MFNLIRKHSRQSKNFLFKLKALTKSNYDKDWNRSRYQSTLRFERLIWFYDSHKSSRWLRCLHDDIKAFKGLSMKTSDEWDHRAITSFIYIAPVSSPRALKTPAYDDDDCATFIYDLACHKLFRSSSHVKEDETKCSKIRIFFSYFRRFVLTFPFLFCPHENTFISGFEALGPASPAVNRR